MLGSHALVAILLFLPVLYYSLNTPFALIDDYDQWSIVRIFDSPQQFSEWLDNQFLEFNSNRYRPFWEFYNAVTWKVFGPIPWLHHLARWVVHFGSIFTFAAAFLCFARDRRAQDSAASRFARLLPVAVLVYLWMFFPNQPATRLGPQEVYTVFFLGLCTWMMALMLVRAGSEERLRSTLSMYGLFCLGFFGLAWSKETNISALLWMLVCYYALLLIEARRRGNHGNQPGGGRFAGVVHAVNQVSGWKILGSLPLLLVFLHTLWVVYLATKRGGYGTPDLTPELILGNSSWILGQLFQIDTSPVITIGFAALLAPLLLFVMVKAAKRRFDNEVIFVLFLFGQFVSLYVVVCTSWQQALRYWYILIPVFTTLLAFSAKFVLAFAEERLSLRFNSARLRISPRLAVAFGLAGFIAFFICCNYYNFLHQTIIQHSNRHTEAKLIAEISHLHNQGHYIQLQEGAEFNEWKYNLLKYFREFLPRFHGEEYRIHSLPPVEAGHPYYLVDLVEYHHDLPENYEFLSYARKVAGILQKHEPYLSWDAGTNGTTWRIHDNELGGWHVDDQDVFRLVEKADEPIIRSVYDVYHTGDKLIYTKNPCDPDDIDPWFFLHVHPTEVADLPDPRRQHGFDSLDFRIEHAVGGYQFDGRDGRCLAVRELPDYDISRITTGQYIPGEGRIWASSFETEGRRRFDRRSSPKD